MSYGMPNNVFGGANNSSTDMGFGGYGGSRMSRANPAFSENYNRLAASNPAGLPTSIDTSVMPNTPTAAVGENPMSPAPDQNPMLQSRLADIQRMMEAQRRLFEGSMQPNSGILGQDTLLSNTQVGDQQNQQMHGAHDHGGGQMGGMPMNGPGGSPPRNPLENYAPFDASSPFDKKSLGGGGSTPNQMPYGGLASLMGSMS